MNSYELSRNWFDWCFENPEKINTNHHAIYFFAIEHCNRLGWKEKFGFPSQMTMDAIGIKNYRTYIKAFNDLVEFGFIDLIKKSSNQYSANVIAIVKNTKATTKALDNAFTTHNTKQSQSNVSIDKQTNNITNKQINNIYSFDEFWDLYDKKNDRKKCEQKFNRLTNEQLKKIKEVLPIYIKSKPDVIFRKNPLTWLNGECWNDEVKNETILQKESNNPYGLKIIL
jgi:hypothetical protein